MATWTGVPTQKKYAVTIGDGGMVGGFGPEFLQAIVKGINLAMPGNAFEGLLSMVPLSGATTETWISLGVSIAWAVGSTVLAYALFKSRATLGR